MNQPMTKARESTAAIICDSQLQNIFKTNTSGAVMNESTCDDACRMVLNFLVTDGAVTLGLGTFFGGMGFPC